MGFLRSGPRTLAPIETFGAGRECGAEVPMAALSLEARIDELIRKDRRYSAEAYQYVFDALDYVLQHPACRSTVSRHITVSELLEGFRRLGLEQFGPLARCVFESWGVYSTSDFGEIVFKLIENDLLNQGDHDRREDFAKGFDFREAFEEGYRPVLRTSDRD
jgi:uncharacterized repeat protein (TIGR04138 family)